MMWSAHKTKPNAAHDNRTKLLGAVIFLFGFAIVARLLTVQVLHHDVYAARALQQHGVAEEILPERGRIFVRISETDSELYPLAANKEFALIYAVPTEIKNPPDAAERLLPLLYPLTHEEPDREQLIIAIEQRLREELFNAAVAQNPPAAGAEVVIDEDELAVALEKERLLLEERLQKELEENMDAYRQELEETFAKSGDPYEPLVHKVDKSEREQIMAVGIAGIAYSLSSYRYYPEDTIGSNVLGYVLENPDNDITQGSYGLEGYFNAELAGTVGAIRAERDARGSIIIVAAREVRPAVDGSDLIVTLDKTVQDFVCRAFNRSALRHGASLGAVIAMDPATGAIIAMCSYPDFDPNNYGKVESLEQFNNAGIFNAYEPGSIFKGITMAAGIDTGMVAPESTFTDTGSYTVATETIKNADNKVYGEVTMTEILEQSINTGAMYVARKIGINNFVKYVQDFGFGAQTGIELKTEVAGNLSSLFDRYHGANLNLAVASFGQSITTTPLQMLAAYGAIANGGVLYRPYIVDTIIAPDGTRTATEPVAVRRVLSGRAALLTSGMLVKVVDSGHAGLAAVPGYYVAGKTGTAQIASENARGYSNKTNHSFVGFAPANDPKFVMIVYFKDPKDVRFSASSAAPLFGEIAKFMLNYYQVERER